MLFQCRSDNIFSVFFTQSVRRLHLIPPFGKISWPKVSINRSQHELHHFIEYDPDINTIAYILADKLQHPRAQFLGSVQYKHSDYWIATVALHPFGSVYHRG